MQIGILTSPESWYFNDLRRAAGSRHNVTDCSFRQLAATVGGFDRPEFLSGGTQLHRFDAVLVRTMPLGSLEQVVFRMDVLGSLKRAGCIVVNPPRALEAAVDKYLALTKLQDAGLLTPKTLVCQTVEDAMEGFESLGGDVVVKPLFGSEGRGMTRVSDENIALRVFKSLAHIGSVIYLQQFVQHEGFDIRILMIGDRTISMRRHSTNDWRTNVSRGASTEPFEPNETLCETARRAVEAVGATMAGVDILPGCNGQNYVLEVNAVPGWKAMSRTHNIDIALWVLEHLEQC